MNFSGKTVYSANPPPLPQRPWNPKEEHKLYFPSKHAGHLPHATIGSTITLSPALKLVTFSPTSTTSPEN